MTLKIWSHTEFWIYLIFQKKFSTGGIADWNLWKWEEVVEGEEDLVVEVVAEVEAEEEEGAEVRNSYSIFHEIVFVIFTTPRKILERKIVSYFDIHIACW